MTTNPAPAAQGLRSGEPAHKIATRITNKWRHHLRAGVGIATDIALTIDEERALAAGRALEVIRFALECGERDGPAAAMAVLNTHGRDALSRARGEQ